MTTTKDIWSELRKPFPKGVVGKVNKGFGEIDYVGHAAVTDRLLEVDPLWFWEPLALDELGLPALDKEGNLWIKLHVNSVVRLGVGDGKNMKERIGDALRNAAMRFGVALDLWSKDELESTLEHPENKNIKGSQGGSGTRSGATNVGASPTPPAIDPPHPEEPAKDINEDKVTISGTKYKQLVSLWGELDMLTSQGVPNSRAKAFMTKELGKPKFENNEELEKLIMAAEGIKVMKEPF